MMNFHTVGLGVTARRLGRPDSLTSPPWISFFGGMFRKNVLNIDIVKDFEGFENKYHRGSGVSAAGDAFQNMERSQVQTRHLDMLA